MGRNHRAACHDPRRGEVWQRPDYPICAIARTSEAKALGIRMGAPFFQIRDLCRREKVVVFSSNYALYGDMSARLLEATNDTLALVRAACSGARDRWQAGYRFSKAGIVTVDLVPPEKEQRALIGGFDWDRGDRLMAALDALNAR